MARVLSEPLTAESASRAAMANNPRLRAAMAAARLAEADVWQAGRLPNPDVAGALRFPAEGGPAASTITVGFNVLDGLMIPLRRRLARESLGVAEKRAADEALELVVRVFAGWHALAARQEWRATLARLHAEDEARAAALGRSAGPLAAAHARAEAAETATELARVDAQVAADRERLNVLMGLDGADAALWTLATKEPAVPAARPNITVIESLSRRARLDVAAARAEAELVWRAYELKRKTRLLPVGVEVGVESERERSGERLTGPTLKLGLPIFDQGQAELARLRAAWEQAADRAAALEAEAGAAARAAAVAVDAASRAEASQREGCLVQARKIWDETSRQARAGAAGPMALHAARRELVAAERKAIEARLEYWLARGALARALGGGAPAGEAASAARPGAT